MLQAFTGTNTPPLNGTNSLTADSLVGCAVFNYQNDKLGVIKEVLMDVEHGNIACIFLSYGGFLGVGSHILPVPRPEFAFHITEKYLLLDMELEDIRLREPAMNRLFIGPGFR
ncbi:PRC-barrel domain-containing protein [Haliea sp. E1-2-M8]|uniref:PRC-barrel domain-containing protein n=1 Tax=Haliea sp. E1-2-M8 TaxID=3064706 RepID=UPI00271BE9DB|nr:PRC-barrel domain-containing protein [Haliea sp. E1-2-M8]MDO8861801.1 PRC-barrel domain-containing protein [Haliea sp. E1-2-M8]